MTGGQPEGLLVVDKPAGMTSHDVVSCVRRALGTRKVGHGGTLDPDATGVLVVGVGAATRLLRFVTDLDKTYTGEVVLGSATTTLDDSGDVTEVSDMSAVTLADARAAATALAGEIDQVPPMVSAIRVGGRRLHELARAGMEVERTARRVRVQRFEVDEGPVPGVVRIAVDCSSGTYVRALAADLGTALGGHAHLRRLVRTRIGPFTLADATPLDEVDRGALRPPSDLVAHLGEVVVSEELATMVRHGRVLTTDLLGAADGGPWAVTSSGALLAVYVAHGEGLAKPLIVYRSAEQ